MTRVEYSKDLPAHYSDLQLRGGLLQAENIAGQQNSQFDLKDDNEFLDGLFSYKQLTKFLANETTSITTAMKNLLANLFVKTAQIRSLMLGIQFKRRISTRNSRLEILKRRLPHVFQEHFN